MQMLYLFLCVYVFHSVSAAGGTGDVTATPNPLACKSDGTFTYKYSKADVKSVTSSCGTASLDSNKTVTITGCPVGNTTIIHLYNSVTTPAIVKDPAVDIVLKCVFGNGEYKAHVSFSESGTAKPVTAKIPIPLTMTLYNDGTNTQTPNVVIGTQYDLKITGAGDKYMKLKGCQADANSDMKHSVPVYNSDSDTIDIMTLPTPTPAPSSGINKHPLLVKMTGFRLVQSTSVYLECTIQLCDTPDCSPAGKRKRNKAEITKANLQFQVIGTNDQFHTSDATDIHAAGRLMVTLGIVAVARYLFQ